jgi:hypothetical protein
MNNSPELTTVLAVLAVVSGAIWSAVMKQPSGVVIVYSMRTLNFFVQ